MTNENQKPEAVAYAQVLFDRLTATDAIAEELKSAGDALVRLDPKVVAAQETELMASYRGVIENQPENEARRQELMRQMEELDYMGSKYYYRAALRKYEMESHPEQLWLDLVDDEKVAPIRDVIEASPLLTRQQFVGSVPDVSDGPVIILDGDKVHTISIPTSNLIHATSFESWEAGRGGGKMSDSGDIPTSAAVIDDYAFRNAPVPPLEQVYGYIQPSGTIVYAVSEGTHRAAAAIKRGEQTVATQQLRLVCVSYDLAGDTD